MKKLIIFFMTLLSFNVHSNIKRLNCPDSIICSYELGKCKYTNAHEWGFYTFDANERFRGAIKMPFSGAIMNRQNIACVYSYGTKSHFILGPYLNKKNIILSNGWGWVKDGFGNKDKVCYASATTAECGIIIKETE